VRELRVSIDSDVVGVLSEGDGLWQFTYESAWVDAPMGFDLAPGLPRSKEPIVDAGTLRPVQWFFDNLLPEELLRQALEKEAGLQGDDAFALIQYLGAESAGSLTLLPPQQAFPGTGDLRPLSDEDLSKRLAQLPRRTLTADAPKRMSLAGAQHKLLVHLGKGQLFEPVGATPSTHILKPSHPAADDYPASVLNEYLTMRLAKAAGLEVPRVDLRYVPEPVYIIERFDRVVASAGRGRASALPALNARRLHIIDACQLLNKARNFKFSGATLASLQDVINATTNKASTRTRLFRWLAFNALVANNDCHLKNLSFHVNHEGIELAPHYDLLATGAYYTKAVADDDATWPHVKLAIPLPDAEFLSDVTRAKLLAAGEALGVPVEVSERILDQVLVRVMAAFKIERELAAQRAAQIPEGGRLHLASDDRLLRVLEHIVLPEMRARLAAAS